MRRVATAGLFWLGVCASAAGQTAAPDRPGPYVVDVRGTTVSLPQDASVFPPVPSSTVVPSRGWGLDAGAHVYFAQLGAARLGIGGILVRARGTAAASSPATASGSTATAATTTPAVAALWTSVAPQVSFNFGSRAGWSYLSAGIGRAQITTRASAFGTTPARLLDPGTRSSINVGGGARWFTAPRLAFSFDVRFHMMGAGTGETPAPGETLLAASVGLSLR
jgi:hypothetical protein